MFFYGPQAQEGTYTVKLTKGKETYTSEVKLVPDPRTKSTAADRELQHKTVTQLYDMLAQLTYIVDATSELREQAKAAARRPRPTVIEGAAQRLPRNWRTSAPRSWR